MWGNKIFPQNKEVIVEGSTFYWITERASYELMPLQEQTYQFFRELTNYILLSVDESAPNPYDFVPDR